MKIDYFFATTQTNGDETYLMMEDTSQKTIKENVLIENKKKQTCESKTKATTIKCLQKQVFVSLLYMKIYFFFFFSSV